MVLLLQLAAIAGETKVLGLKGGDDLFEVSNDGLVLVEDPLAHLGEEVHFCLHMDVVDGDVLEVGVG